MFDGKSSKTEMEPYKQTNSADGIVIKLYILPQEDGRQIVRVSIGEDMNHDFVLKPSTGGCEAVRFCNTLDHWLPTITLADFFLASTEKIQSIAMVTIHEIRGVTGE